MHVDWDWIKQRPQFLAESLSSYYNLIVLYPLAFRRKQLTKNAKIKSVTYVPYIKLPMQSLFLPVAILNWLILNLYVAVVVLLCRIDCIWMSFPTHYILWKARLIYDYMDNYVNMNTRTMTLNRSFYSWLEKSIMKKSALVFASSRYLMRNYPDRQMVLLRNAFDRKEQAAAIKVCQEMSRNKQHGLFTIGYIGTIGSWFDWDIIKKSLECNFNIQYVFIGPFGKCRLIDTRIKYTGAIPHSELYMTIKECDCFIMPFKINDIVLAVDPVKLYEYIDWHKNIISIYYEEIERFSSFVYFYNNYDEFQKIIEHLTSNNTIKYSNVERINFLNNNDWHSRGRIIVDELNHIMSSC